MDNPYVVYVKTNDSGYITSVNSSAFLSDVTDWTEIDSGNGDKYHHAQGNYFPKSIWTDGGAYRYKLVDSVPTECTPEEIAQQEDMNKPTPEPDVNLSVWDELDSAYQEGYNEGYTEGVNSAYDQ